MKNSIFTLLCAMFIFSGCAQENPFFNKANSFFEEYVHDGNVEYKALQKNREPLDEMVNLLRDEPKHEGDEQKAFLINAYNILVIKMVVDNYPVEGPLKVDGFFDNVAGEVQQEKTSLNDLEKKKLGVNFKDPLLHFALVCGAKGCPILASRAYTPVNLTAQLEEQATVAINNSSFTRVDKKTGTLQLSQIFEWYADDFGGKEEVINFVMKHYSGDVKDKKSFSHYQYDWSLNQK